MDAPNGLSHTPIISVNDYSKIDGKYTNETDAEALSIGYATFDNKDISAKVWRYDKNNSKWSRQSEELPLHRVLDLSILIIGSFIKDAESDFPVTHLKESFNIGADTDAIQQYYRENKKKLTPRIEELERVIDLFKKNEHKITTKYLNK